MRVGDITLYDLKDYLRLDMAEVEQLQLEAMLASAKAYVKSFTGLTDVEVDEREDLTIAVYVLVQDMYDNRTMYVEKNNTNKVVETILGMHSKNLL